MTGKESVKKRKSKKFKPPEQAEGQNGPENEPGQGRIIVADDIQVNLETLKLQLESIGVEDRCEFLVNGQ
jgi:hypothetical protein